MKHIALYIITLFTLSSCITKIYLNQEDVRMLVVDGFIQQDTESSVTLSYSTNITDLYYKTYINDATLWLEDSKGGMIMSSFTSDGRYSLDTKHNIFEDEEYRLHIWLTNGETYESEIIPMYEAPEIDSLKLTYTIDNTSGEYQFFFDLINNVSEARYYRAVIKLSWKQVIAVYDPHIFPHPYRYVDTILHKTIEKVYRTDHFSSNAMRCFFINIHPDDPKLRTYIITRIDLYAIPYKGYLFWENTYNNRDDLGGIYSPQPNNPIGNIICTSDPSKTGLGYINGGKKNTLRKIFTREDF